MSSESEPSIFNHSDTPCFSALWIIWRWICESSNEPRRPLGQMNRTDSPLGGLNASTPFIASS